MVPLASRAAGPGRLRERVSVGCDPLRECAGRAARHVLYGGEDPGEVVVSVGKYAHERVYEIGRRRLAQLLASLIVRQGHELQRSSERISEDPQTLRGQQ